MKNDNTSYIDSFHIGPSVITQTDASSYFPIMASAKEKPWICIIEGLSADFTYQRKFLESKIQNLKAPHDQFKKISWKLTSGFIYEYKNFLCAFNEDQKDAGYFGVSDAGIKTLTKDELRKTMKLRVKGDTKKEIIKDKSLLEYAQETVRQIDNYVPRDKPKKKKPVFAQMDLPVEIK